MKIALLQMTTGPDMSRNLAGLEDKIREAVSGGAKIILTPENTDFLGVIPHEKRERALPEVEHPFPVLCSSLARELKVWILLGSIAVKLPSQKINNRSYLFSPQGEVQAVYNKIHLFDADLPNGEKYRESDIVEYGTRIVTTDTEFGKVGLSICYDVRFPHIFRHMAKVGAQMIFIPAAFAVHTGELHWEILLRARAIENGAFVIAPAQCGNHGAGRTTYGHSMVIDPWGRIIAKAGDIPEILYADIDLDEVSKFRASIPSLHHDIDVYEH